MAYAYQIDNTNLAYDYDLSRFDTAAREQRARENGRAKSKITIAPAASASKSGNVMKLVVAIAALTGALMAVNYCETEKDNSARMVVQQEAELAAATDDNALLQSKLESMANIGYIEQYATENLGMTKVSSSQKKYVSVNTESLIETAEDDSACFLGSVKYWFKSILEYIGV